jgi:hypothetical protein
VVLSVGFSLGIALGGFVLAGYTAAGGLFPDPAGYTAAGWAGVLVSGLTVLAVLALRRRPADFPGR